MMAKPVGLRCGSSPATPGVDLAPAFPEAAAGCPLAQQCLLRPGKGSSEVGPPEHPRRGPVWCRTRAWRWPAFGACVALMG